MNRAIVAPAPKSAASENGPNILCYMRTVSISECLESAEFWEIGGFVDLGPDYVIDLGSDCDIVLPATPSPKRTGGSVPRRRIQNPKVRKRGKRPVWYAQPYEYVPMPDGTEKRMRRTVTFGPTTSISKRAAQAELQKRLLKMNGSAAPARNSGMKLRDFISEWRLQVAVHFADSSRRAAESHIKSHINPRLGDFALTEINNKTIQAFVTALSNVGRDRKTIENILNTLTGILNKARSFGYASGQFSRKDLTLPRKGPGREVKFFDAAQVGSIIAKSAQPYATMFAVLGMTGLRASEMLGLKIADLDFHKKLIHIHRSVDSRTRMVQPTKTEASAASIPLPAELENRLQRFIHEHWRENPEGFLFVNSNRNTYALGKVVQYGLWPAQDACGIPRAGLHAFRHQHASELLNGGAAPNVVQKQLRHTNAKITLERYAHVIGDAQRVAVSTVAAKIERFASQLEPSA